MPGSGGGPIGSSGSSFLSLPDPLRPSVGLPPSSNSFTNKRTQRSNYIHIKG